MTDVMIGQNTASLTNFSVPHVMSSPLGHRPPARAIAPGHR